MEGIKHDQEKPTVALLPGKALLMVAQVLDFGARKYSANNWRKGLAFSRLISAAERHLFALNDGEVLDPETNLPHEAHAICELLFLLQLRLENRQDLDDTYQPNKAVGSAGQTTPHIPEETPFLDGGNSLDSTWDDSVTGNADDSLSLNEHTSYTKTEPHTSGGVHSRKRVKELRRAPLVQLAAYDRSALVVNLALVEPCEYPTMPIALDTLLTNYAPKDIVYILFNNGDQWRFTNGFE